MPTILILSTNDAVHIETEKRINNIFIDKLEDKIKLITEDQIVSEIIQSGAGKNSYFQYYLNANSKSIIKLKYKKKNNILVLDGKKIQSYCTNVKPEWSKRNKKFINKNDEFTINIAFKKNKMPEAGVIYAPAKKKMYFSGLENKAYEIEFSHDVEKVPFQNKRQISVNPISKNPLTATISRSHNNEKTDEFQKN